VEVAEVVTVAPVPSVVETDVLLLVVEVVKVDGTSNHSQIIRDLQFSPIPKLLQHTTAIFGQGLRTSWQVAWIKP
jgi:hypothetical protein